MNLIGKLRREKEFRQQCCRNSTKMRREKKKKGERESKGISATLLPKFLCPKYCPFSLKKSNCGNAIAEKGKKKICFGNCGNAIAKNGKKNYKICEWVKKKSCHVHNIFTINHTWLIIISSKNLWKINCGNGIAENVKKKLWNLWMSKKKVVTYTIFSQ